METDDQASFARKFIMSVHDAVPGITANVLACGKTADGRSSYQVLAETAGLRPGMTAVDLACGSGVLTRLISAQVGSTGWVIGVDLNAAELELAKAHCRDCGNVVFRGESAAQLSMPAHSTDAVLCHLALMLFQPVEPVLAEVARILRPGGIFAAVVPGLNGESAEFAAIRQSLVAELAREVPPERLIALGNAECSDAGAIKKLLARNGRFAPEPELAGFEVIFQETPELLASRLMPFFYYSYLLSEAGKQNLRRAWTETLCQTVPAGDVRAVFRLSLTVVTARKYND